MNAQDLKNSILQLAIQGKLVEQREEEGAAKELIEKIKAEKDKLIKEKKLKREKALSEITEDEIPFDIPENWEWVRCSDVFNVRSASRIHKTDWKPTGVPFLRGRELVQLSKRDSFDAEIFIDEELYEKFKEKTGIPLKDDLLVSAVGTIGKVYIVKETDKFYYKDAYILCFENYGKLYSKYIRYMLESVFLQNQIKKDAMATTVAQLTIIKAKSLVMPLPPLEEQKRIVAKIEELLPYVEKYDKAYTEVEELNKRFPEDMQKSILQYAIQGKLVEQREEEGTAEELYQQIQEEKKKLVVEGKIKKQKKLPEISEDEIPFDIPENWKWVRLADVSEKIHYGYTASANEVGNCKLLRITDIQNNSVDWESVPFCDVKDRDYVTYGLNNRDIMIARTGGTIGKTYIVEALNDRAVFASYLIRVVPVNNINEKYLKKFMESPLYWHQLKEGSMGTGQPNVNGTTLSKLVLPLPPLAEQERIVEEIEQLLPYTKQLVK